VELKPDQLAAQARRGPLKPAYLIAGPELLTVIETADAVRERARADGCEERDVFDFNADSDWSPVESAFASMGLFGTGRLVEVRLATGKPGKDGAKVITGFCADPPPGVILLVTGAEWSKAHAGKWTEAIARVGDIAVAWAVKPHDLPGWIEQRMRSRGVTADRAAVDLLASRMEGNLLAAAQEIDKLALVAHGERIDAARMEALVADAARYDVFRLLDVALGGQPAQVARMLAGLQHEGTSVHALLGMVVMELQRLAVLAQVKARGGNLASEFRAQRIWDSKQAQYQRALGRYTPVQWQRLLAEVSRVDRASKGRAGDDPWIALERLLLAVAEPKASRLLAAHA